MNYLINVNKFKKEWKELFNQCLIHLKKWMNKLFNQ